MADGAAASTFPLAASEDGEMDLMFGSTVILLIVVGYGLLNLWSKMVPTGNAMVRSLSLPSLSEMPFSARTAAINMLAEFDARSDPIAAAAKEAKTQREVAKKSSLPRVASLPTLVEGDDEAGLKSHDDWEVPMRKAPSMGGGSGMKRIASLPSGCGNNNGSSMGGARVKSAAQLQLERKLNELNEQRQPTDADGSRNVLTGGYTTRSASPLSAFHDALGTSPPRELGRSSEAGATLADTGKPWATSPGDTSPTDIEWEPPLDVSVRRAMSPETARRRKSGGSSGEGSPPPPERMTLPVHVPSPLGLQSSKLN